MTSINTETRARAICAMDLSVANPPPKDLRAAIDRYWPVIAHEIESGVQDAQIELPPDLPQRIDEYKRLRRTR